MGYLKTKLCKSRKILMCVMAPTFWPWLFELLLFLLTSKRLPTKLFCLAYLLPLAFAADAKTTCCCVLTLKPHDSTISVALRETTPNPDYDPQKQQEQLVEKQGMQNVRAGRISGRGGGGGGGGGTKSGNQEVMSGRFSLDE